MRVFISWSGDASGKVAKHFSDFLEHVVSGLSTFMSEEDIELGSRWEENLSSELMESNYALICVTRANQLRPWINYEAGAIWKGLGKNRVIPYTLGFSPGELLPGPLTRFQGVENSEDGTRRIVKAINEAMPNPKPEQFIEEAFVMWWPRFKEAMDATLASEAGMGDANIPTDRQMLIEMRQDIVRILKHTVELSNIDAVSTLAALNMNMRDALTGLYNRRAFLSKLTKLQAAEVSCLVTLIDLDNFKALNDSYGHSVGDQMLVRFADHLANVLHSAEMIARWGGEEFVAVFLNIAPEQVAELLTAALDSMPTIHVNEKEIPSMTFSAGVSQLSVGGVEEKLVTADRSLFQAKNSGRAKIVISTDVDG